MHVGGLIRLVARFAARRRRPLAIAAVLLLLIGPAPFTGSGEAVLLNAAGLAWVGLLVLRLMGTGTKNRTTTKRRTR